MNLLPAGCCSEAFLDYSPGLDSHSRGKCQSSFSVKDGGLSEVQVPQEFKQEDLEPGSITGLLLMKTQDLGSENASLTQTV